MKNKTMALLIAVFFLGTSMVMAADKVENTKPAKAKDVKVIKMDKTQKVTGNPTANPFKKDLFKNKKK